MCGEPGLSESGKPLPAITRKVYNLATRIRVTKKREVLDAWLSSFGGSSASESAKRTPNYVSSPDGPALLRISRAPTVREKGRRHLCDLSLSWNLPVALAITSRTRHSIEGRTRRRGE
jgi:hypothetical protein